MADPYQLYTETTWKKNISRDFKISLYFAEYDPSPWALISLFSSFRWANFGFLKLVGADILIKTCGVRLHSGGIVKRIYTLKNGIWSFNLLSIPFIGKPILFRTLLSFFIVEPWRNNIIVWHVCWVKQIPFSDKRVSVFSALCSSTT